MQTLSMLAMRTLSALATLILNLASIPIRISAVESRWVTGRGLDQQPGDDIVDWGTSTRSLTAASAAWMAAETPTFPSNLGALPEPPQ